MDHICSESIAAFLSIDRYLSRLRGGSVLLSGLYPLLFSCTSSKRTGHACPFFGSQRQSSLGSQTNGAAREPDDGGSGPKLRELIGWATEVSPLHPIGVSSSVYPRVGSTRHNSFINPIQCLARQGVTGSAYLSVRRICSFPCLLVRIDLELPVLVCGSSA